MPYSSKKTGKNEITVMKKDSGEVVGHTTPGKYNAYMAALHIHEKPDHMCHGGCAGYAKGGRVPEELMDAIERNREEIGLPGKEGNVSDAMNLVPGLGLMKQLSEASDIHDRMVNPELLHNTAGKGLETNFQHGGPSDTFGREADAPMMAEGGVVDPDSIKESPIIERLRSYMMGHNGAATADQRDSQIAMNVDPSTTSAHGYAAGGRVADDETKDPSEIPEEVREFIDKMHKDQRESRPDESWRITPAKKPEAIAPYKRDEEEAAAEPDMMDRLRGMNMPHYDDGGQVPDPNQLLQDIAPAGTGTLVPSPAAPVQPPEPPPIQAQTPDLPPALPAAAKPAMAAPASTTDQDFMDRANKMLGLGPDQQAGLMKLLGGNAQKAQLGAGLAGIGDAIASGGTLGKVNPGALNKSEDLIQDRTKEGIEGMQTIRGNQEKAQELSDKLEARDPNSPLSKYAQKAYAGIGKKLGLDLSHASAALIGDVSGKGVEALNTEYQGQLKMMQLGLQKDTLKATQENQKAERDIARQGQSLQATKDLGARTLGNKLEGVIPGTPANVEKKSLENIASGQKGPVPVNSRAEYDALPAGTHYVDSHGTEKIKG